ncbi:uncharacterized protein [Macrobrachium rosenbergii]|uniref:uncharacterized protein isoform X2 n=1 Tax=Macrobrachium rosenbergii TaxID=79674 RepID=UPI0034D61722
MHALSNNANGLPLLRMFGSLHILAFLLIEVTAVSTSPAEPGKGVDALAAKRNVGYETKDEIIPQKSSYLPELKAVDRHQRQIRFKGSYQQLPKGLPHQASEEVFAHHDDDRLSYFIQVDVEDEPHIDMNFRNLPKGSMTYFPPEVIPLDLLYSSEDDDTFGFLSFHDEHESKVKDSRENAAKSHPGLSPFYIPPNEDIDYDSFFITHSSSAEELKPVFLAKDFSSVSTSTSQPSVNFESHEIGHHHNFDSPSVNSDSLETDHHRNFDRPSFNLDFPQIGQHLNVDRPSVNSDSLEIEPHLNFDRPSPNLDSLEIDRHHNVDRPSVNLHPPEIKHHHNIDSTSVNSDPLNIKHIDSPSVNSDPLNIKHIDSPSVNSDPLNIKHHHNFDEPSSENAPFHFLSDTLGESDIPTNNVLEAGDNNLDFRSSFPTTSNLSTHPSLTTSASHSFPSQTTTSDSPTAESGEIFFITGHSGNSNDTEDYYSFSTTLINSQPLHISSTPATIFDAPSSFLLPQTIPHNHGPNIQHQDIVSPSSTSALHHDITGPSFTSALHHDIFSPSSTPAQKHDITGPSFTSALQQDITGPPLTSALPKSLSTTKLPNPDLSIERQKSPKFSSKESRRKLSGHVTNQSSSSKERASKEESSDRSIPGIPGTDYPLYHTVPVTSFDCSTKEFGGYYADPETSCQAFHICLGRKSHSFLCPIGTMFNQKLLVCDWWYNSVCVKEPQHQI